LDFTFLQFHLKCGIPQLLKINWLRKINILQKSLNTAIVLSNSPCYENDTHGPLPGDADQYKLVLQLIKFSITSEREREREAKISLSRSASPV
jgi:hypothetical protein